MGLSGLVTSRKGDYHVRVITFGDDDGSFLRDAIFYFFFETSIHASLPHPHVTLLPVATEEDKKALEEFTCELNSEYHLAKCRRIKSVLEKYYPFLEASLQKTCKAFLEVFSEAIKQRGKVILIRNNV